MTTSSAPPSESWTTRKLLAWLCGHFAGQNIEPARIIAEMLLAQVIGVERIALYMEPDRPAQPSERAELRDLVRRATQGEPVQYLVGWTTFYSERIEISPVTQIPQPCTEELVAVTVRALRERPEGAPTRLADIGTGSGCIAIALARAFPAAQIVAVDLYEEAAELARRNVERSQLGERIEVRCGDCCEPLAGEEPFDAIVSNPPYIPDAQWEGGLVEASVKKFVPARALRGGADGLEIIRRLVEEAPARLGPGGILAFEMADAHAEGALALVQSAEAMTNAGILLDDEGYRRIIRAVKRSG